MSFLTRLFSPEAASKTIGAVTKGIDNANFTPQEQAVLHIEELKALAPFKVVQRILVSAIAFVWVLLILQYCVAMWLELPDIKTDLLALMVLPFVAGPTIAGFMLYFSGGLRKKD